MQILTYNFAAEQPIQLITLSTLPHTGVLLFIDATASDENLRLGEQVVRYHPFLAISVAKQLRTSDEEQSPINKPLQLGALRIQQSTWVNRPEKHTCQTSSERRSTEDTRPDRQSR